MAQGSKAKYSAKQKRQAKHIEDSEKKSGRSSKAAARIAWATVNKQDGGAKGTSARKKKSASSKKSGGAMRSAKASRTSSRSASAHA